MNEETKTANKAATLDQAVALLESLLVETQNLVFGEELEKPEQRDNTAPMPNKIQSSINRIIEVTEELKRINMSLQVIG